MKESVPVLFARIFYNATFSRIGSPKSDTAPALGMVGRERKERNGGDESQSIKL
jgi:hypothetical protein